MAIWISKLALLLMDRPEVAIERLIEGGLISAKGLSHRQEIRSLLEDTQKIVNERSKDPEITGPQPTAGFQYLASLMDRSGFLSPAGSKLHNAGFEPVG